MFVESKALEMDIRITETIDKVTGLEKRPNRLFLLFVIKHLVKGPFSLSKSIARAKIFFDIFRYSM